MIELKHVAAGYGKHTVLKDISVSFENGTLTSIIGPNGCGKSTLLKTILGIVSPEGGEITIDGHRTNSLSRKEIARRVAYLSQSRNTPDMTVEQLVLHGRFPHLDYPRRYKKPDYEIAFSAMEQLGIADYAKAPLHTLSGGMRQTAYIAMALTQDTDYILLDEPTTYLDIAHQVDVIKVLKALAVNGKGIIAVMHDLPMAFTYSDKIVLLDHGKLAGNDTPARIFHGNAIAQTFGVALACTEKNHTYRYQFTL